MAWYSHIFMNFPQSVVIYRVKDFSVVTEAEVDVFWNSLALLLLHNLSLDILLTFLGGLLIKYLTQERIIHE